MGFGSSKAAGRRFRRGQGGISLVEIMVSLAIIGVIVGGATLGFRSLLKSELRSNAGRLAAAIRYSYDRAITTGSYYRLHFNLDEQTYKLEKAEGRVLLSRDREGRKLGGRGQDLDKVAEEKAKDDERRFGTNSTQAGDLAPPPLPARPKFQDFKDTTLPQVKLKRIKVLDLLTPRQEEPYSRGHAYLHFFPDGHTERAVIHLGFEDSDDDQYTLIVHGLTGRVEIRPGRVIPPSEFGTTDDLGEKQVER